MIRVKRARFRYATPRHSVALAVLSCLAIVSAVCASIPAAAANPPGPHDPFGAVTATSTTNTGVHFSGWAVEPDARTSNVGIVVLVDGSTVATGKTSTANSAITSRYHAGPTPGFAITGAVATSGSHTVCVAAKNVGSGLSTILKCIATPTSVRLTSAQLAAHNPKGSITSASAGPSSFRVKGWATDPDWPSRPSTVVLYVDGFSVATVNTSASPAPLPSGAGPNSSFDITVPVSGGTHLGCLWVVNVGLGTGNKFIGCRARDTRGPAGTGTLTQPALNSKVVAEAKRHVGQPYVWGATGPSAFDCSGLVKYSYGKFGFTTPRVSEAQAVAARLVPVSRALPGDLVFYHDSLGDVYHVGIYLSPGRTVAAIDTNQGVNYQTIWDPSSATYGSFTHT